MNIKYKLILLIFTLTFSSCSQKKEIEFENYKGLIATLVNCSEQTIERNNELVKSVNGFKLTLEMLTYDPQSRKTAEEVIPLFNKASIQSNKIDDFFLKTLNEIIEKEEGVKHWFIKVPFNQQTSNNSFYGLKNVDSPNWTTKLLGTNSKESIEKAEKLRISLLKYRDELILTIADSVLNDKNQLMIISIDNLLDVESFKEHLKQIELYNKYELLKIYEQLTISKEIIFSDANILWNQKAFQNQPLIGAISTLNFYRNKIRSAQITASKILLSRVDRPLKQLYKYQEVENNK